MMEEEAFLILAAGEGRTVAQSFGAGGGVGILTPQEGPLLPGAEQLEPVWTTFNPWEVATAEPVPSAGVIAPDYDPAAAWAKWVTDKIDEVETTEDVIQDALDPEVNTPWVPDVVEDPLEVVHDVAEDIGEVAKDVGGAASIWRRC